MHVKEIRLARLLVLLNAFEGRGRQRALGLQIKKAPAQISQWVNGTRTIEEETAREIERNAKLAHGWMDLPISRAPGAPAVAPAHIVQEPAPAPYPIRSWPFKSIEPKELLALGPERLNKLEGVMREFINAWSINSEVAPKAKKSRG